jgi:hypothetical protein
MFREPSRHDKVLRKAAGGDAGDVGGYSTNWTARPDRSIDRLHLWVLQKDCAGRSGVVDAESSNWASEDGATTLGFAALSEMVTL